MIKLWQYAVIILTLLGIVGCVNDINDIKALVEENNFKEETAKDVKIYYSDSAQVKVIIKAPTLIRHTERSVTNDEFPDGVLVEFMDDNGKIISWLESDYAVKSSLDNEVVVKENVKFYNSANDLLETSELNWNELTGVVHTDKFVKISQPSRRDTSYGYGFVTDESFTRFEIEKYRGVKNADKIKEASQ